MALFAGPWFYLVMLWAAAQTRPWCWVMNAPKRWIYSWELHRLRGLFRFSFPFGRPGPACCYTITKRDDTHGVAYIDNIAMSPASITPAAMKDFVYFVSSPVVDLATVGITQLVTPETTFALPPDGRRISSEQLQLFWYCGAVSFWIERLCRTPHARGTGPGLVRCPGHVVIDKGVLPSRVSLRRPNNPSVCRLIAVFAKRCGRSDNLWCSTGRQGEGRPRLYT